MLEDMKRFLLPTNPIIIPQWNQHINELKLRKEELKRRFLNFYGADSKALRILKHICANVDIEYLDTLTNDYDRYLYYFVTFNNRNENVFNPTIYGKQYHHTFYKRTFFNTLEYLIPTGDNDYIKILPFDSTWDEWSKLKPVVLWYNDSNEFSLDILNDQVKYRFDQPLWATIFIDCCMLGMMYYAYLKKAPYIDDEKTIHNFLHKHVFSKFFDDLEDIWLFNQFKLVVNSVTEEQKIEEFNHLYVYQGGRQKEANTRLHNRLVEVKNGNVKPGGILSSHLLFTGSILNKINYGFEYLDTEHLRQYEFTRILKDIPYLEMILKLYSFRPDHSSYQELTRTLRVMLHRYKINRPWNNLTDTIIKTEIEERIENLYSLVQLKK